MKNGNYWSGRLPLTDALALQQCVCWAVIVSPIMKLCQLILVAVTG